MFGRVVLKTLTPTSLMRDEIARAIVVSAAATVKLGQEWTISGYIWVKKGRS